MKCWAGGMNDFANLQKGLAGGKRALYEDKNTEEGGHDPLADNLRGSRRVSKSRSYASSDAKGGLGTTATSSSLSSPIGPHRPSHSHEKHTQLPANTATPAVSTPAGVGQAILSGRRGDYGLEGMHMQMLPTLADPVKATLVDEEDSPAMYHDLLGLSEWRHGKFDLREIKCLMRQLLEGLQHCHQHHIIHRDITTSNLLLTKQGELQLGDFGLARGTPPTENTLWYRPPELLLGSVNYGTAVDIWCVLAELMTGKPLFNGESDKHMLDMIFRVRLTDRPIDRTAVRRPDSMTWSEAVRLPEWEKHRPERHFPRTIRNRFRGLDETGVDLLDKMLTLDPECRVTASAALEHPFFTHSTPLPCQPSDIKLPEPPRIPSDPSQPLPPLPVHMSAPHHHEEEDSIVPPIHPDEAMQMVSEVAEQADGSLSRPDGGWREEVGAGLKQGMPHHRVFCVRMRSDHCAVSAPWCPPYRHGPLCVYLADGREAGDPSAPTSVSPEEKRHIETAVLATMKQACEEGHPDETGSRRVNLGTIVEKVMDELMDRGVVVGGHPRTIIMLSAEKLLLSDVSYDGSASVVSCKWGALAGGLTREVPGELTLRFYFVRWNPFSSTTDSSASFVSADAPTTINTIALTPPPSPPPPIAHSSVQKATERRDKRRPEEPSRQSTRLLDTDFPQQQGKASSPLGSSSPFLLSANLRSAIGTPGGPTRSADTKGTARGRMHNDDGSDGEDGGDAHKRHSRPKKGDSRDATPDLVERRQDETLKRMDPNRKKMKAMLRAMREMCAHDQLVAEDQRKAVQFKEEDLQLLSQLPTPCFPDLSLMDGLLFRHALQACVVHGAAGSLEALLRETLVKPTEKDKKRLAVGEVRAMKDGKVLQWSDLSLGTLDPSCPYRDEPLSPVTEDYVPSPLVVQAVVAKAPIHIMRTLLAYNADVNARGHAGQRKMTDCKISYNTSAVGAAALWHRPDLLRFLLREAGADPSVPAIATFESEHGPPIIAPRDLLQLVCFGPPPIAAVGAQPLEVRQQQALATIEVLDAEGLIKHGGSGSGIFDINSRD
ncbi:unnamed protein product [Vitrella brassicaformis CCMP3155]|uniref:Cyclin-dependent kinase 2 homolog n=1 Tax=Vitrella brassicaformis (strain CCMP3155) TaxID=1169540 RepID=A0A0G4H7Z4_VITBC|nr:unnamed protein product [Vitrella brassicaformis CCMP3155]|eukprot:CEM39891.1 unnamed protein product [Vitrella brassicaformis CCMP3155]